MADLEIDRWKRKYERERRARLEAEAIAERFTRDALHDPLTGLANRALFMDRVGQALARAGRTGKSLAVVLLDLDGFKEINDTYGHSVGDELLCAIARKLREAFRSVDTVSRLGGDEFALLIEDVAESKKGALIERVNRVFTGHFTVQDQPRQISACVGLTLDRGRDTPSQLLQRADMAMYAAKREGKAGRAVFETSMQKALVLRLEMQSDLERALAADELAVHYQPVVALPSGRITGVEALLRWNRPGDGLVAPAEFLPLAEETGPIVPLGWWVLEQSCRQSSLWQRACPGMSLHVNVSAQQLRDPLAPNRVESALREFGVDPECVVLELTESSVMRDVESSSRTLRKLDGLGVRLGIDDFGTGYSSLSYLQRFPVSVLKIDKSFIDGLATPEGDALVRAILHVGSALGLEVIAEGVETAAQARRLHALGCRAAQGYYFSRPLDAPAMEHLLALPSAALSR